MSIYNYCIDIIQCRIKEMKGVLYYENKRKLLTVVLCLSMVTCLFTGCGGSSEEETTKAASTKHGGDLVIEGLGNRPECGLHSKKERFTSC